MAHEAGGFTAADTGIWHDDNHNELSLVSYAQFDENGEQVGETVSMSYPDVFGEEYGDGQDEGYIQFQINDDGGITVFDGDIERYVTFDSEGSVSESGEYVYEEIDPETGEAIQSYTPDEVSEEGASSESQSVESSAAMLMSGAPINEGVEEQDEVEQDEDDDFELF